MKMKVLASGLVLAAIGAGCSTNTPFALEYSLPADGSVTVSTASLPASSLVRADALLAQAEECGTARSAQYYVDLENLFSGETATRYTFTIEGDYEMPSWTVTVLPNAASYSEPSLFKDDFGICAAGADMYPKLVGANALLFSASCGTGYSDGKENGCAEIKSLVEPTLALE